MRRLKALVCILGAGLFAVTSAPAFAQHYFASPGDHARFEGEGPLKMVIGAASGRNYILAANRGPSEISVEVTVARIKDASSGELTTEQHHLVLDGYSSSEQIFLDTLYEGPSWVAGWSHLETGCSETRLPDRPAIAVLRLPPTYPHACMMEAEPTEHFLLRYDISETGEMENIRLGDTTNGCLYHGVFKQLKNWIFLPAIKDGSPVSATGLETVITFVLED